MDKTLRKVVRGREGIVNVGNKGIILEREGEVGGVGHRGSYL